VKRLAITSIKNTPLENMSHLLAVISPAKLLDDQTHYPELPCTQPLFLNEAEKLVGKLNKLSESKLGEMLDISKALSKETKQQFAQWHLPFSHQNAHPAVFMFKGEVYRGLQAEEWNTADLNFAQKNLRILSGLYGVVRPLDFVMPYRLMMGTPFSPDAKTKNLYAFWGKKITETIKSDLKPKGVLVNLASGEYFKSIDEKSLNHEVIHCEFKERKGDKYSIVSTFAKQARGKMARFLVTHRVEKKQDILSSHTYQTKHTTCSRGRNGNIPISERKRRRFAYESNYWI
jgi:cytoplasmic iron level regulating protein YaaA (DUF328/UPF0246 family)